MSVGCKYCHRIRSIHGRGLCRLCYNRWDVRKLFPISRGSMGHGNGRDSHNHPLPPEPTKDPPGSEGKMKVLVERAEKKQQLFHPNDLVEKVKGYCGHGHDGPKRYVGSGYHIEFIPNDAPIRLYL